MAERGEYTKSREWVTIHSSLSGITPSTTRTTYTHYNGQVTTSISHGGAPRQGSTGDMGGPFNTVKYEYEDSNFMLSAHAGSSKDGIRTYEGPQYAYTSNSQKTDYAKVDPSADDVLDSLGTTAIAAVIPTNPTSSLITTLGELRSEGIPALLGAQNRSNFQRHKFQRDSGSETGLVANAPDAVAGDFLNYQFGWKPLLSDLHKFAKTVKKSDKILNQYRKDADKKIKRSFAFPIESSTVTTQISGSRYPTPVLDSYLYGPTGATYRPGPLTRTITTSRKRWFEGAFRYHLPVGNDVLSKFARFSMEADRLFGVTPSPEVVWNLTPWSWAADWVGNTGDVMTNISAFMSDGLVMQYGYMMEETKTIIEYVLTPLGGVYSEKSGDTGTLGRKPGVPARSCYQRYTSTVKHRRKATPYGFGLNWDGFSPTQFAVLAALGITKGAPKYG